MGTIVSPNKILHKQHLYNPSFHFIFDFLFHLILHYRALNPILGTIVSPNKILHKQPLYNPSFHFIFDFLFHLILHYRALNPILGTIVSPNKIGQRPRVAAAGHGPGFAMGRTPVPRTLHHWTSVSPRGPPGPPSKITRKLTWVFEANPSGTERFLKHFWGPPDPSKCAS